MTIWSWARSSSERTSSNWLFFSTSFRGHLLDQVQALDLEGVAAEDLQGGGHVGHLVAALDVDLGFEVPVGHLPHAGRQYVDPAEQDPAHEAVADGEGRQHAEDADRHQQGATRVDGVVGCLVGRIGGLGWRK